MQEQQQEIIGSSDSLKQLQYPSYLQTINQQDQDISDNSSRLKTLQKDQENEIIEDVPTTLKKKPESEGGGFERQVIELSTMKFKLMGNQLLQIQNQQSGFVRLQQLKINMKLSKDCVIDIELQNQTIKKRLVLNTQNNYAGGNDAGNINVLNQLEGASIYDSVQSNNSEIQKLNGQSKDTSKPQSLYKVNLDGAKLRGRWAIICVDFDRIMPQESIGQKLKINSIVIQAPQSRIYDVQAVYVTLERQNLAKQSINRNLKVSSSTSNLKQQNQQDNQENQAQNQTDNEKNLIKRQRKAYVQQSDDKDKIQHPTFQSKKRSIQPNSQQNPNGPKSYSLNSRQDYEVSSNFSRTPNSMMKVPDLQNLNTKSDTTSQTTATTNSMLKKGLKVIQERVTMAKSAVVSSQKFKKANDENSDNEFGDPQSKGMKFIQKLTERQKRMEERYFKKDNNNKPKVQQQQSQKEVQNHALPLKTQHHQPLQKHSSQNPPRSINYSQLPQPQNKMINTASSGFGKGLNQPGQQTQNGSNFGQQNQNQHPSILGMTHTSHLDFKRSCTFSSTLRNFDYKPQENAQNQQQQQHQHVSKEHQNNDDLEESIQEEICQSQRDNDHNGGHQKHYNGNPNHRQPQMTGAGNQHPFGQYQISQKPPIYNFQTNQLQNKQISVISRDSNLTSGTTGMGGAQSTRSTSIKTPLMFSGPNRLKSSQQEGLGGIGQGTQYSQLSGGGGNFPSASETKQDYFKFNGKEVHSTRSKLLFSPAAQDNKTENWQGQNQGGLLSDREEGDIYKQYVGDSVSASGYQNREQNDMQRYTQNVFDFDASDNQQDDNEEDAQLYMVDVAVEYKADFGLQRRPFSPPFKL
eukprot:403357637